MKPINNYHYNSHDDHRDSDGWLGIALMLFGVMLWCVVLWVNR